MLRRLSHVLLALAAFAGTCVLLRPLVPVPEAYGRRDKWEYWNAHADEYDAVFLGSSVTFRSVVPEILEAELARRGIRFHAFDLASPGTWSVEADFWLQAVLDRRPERLRWVFLETGFPRIARGENPPLHVRFSHTPRTTLHLVRVALGLDRPLVERLDAALWHGRICLENVTNAGQGERVLGRALGRPESAVVLEAAELARRHGYQPLEEDEGAEARRAELLADPGAWLASIEQRRVQERQVLAARPRPELRERPEARLVADQLERARAAGVRLVYLLPPRLDSAAATIQLDRAGVFPELLNYGSPVLEPELYDLELWFDKSHLTREGARRFSERLALGIARVIGEGE